LGNKYYRSFLLFYFERKEVNLNISELEHLAKRVDFQEDVDRQQAEEDHHQGLVRRVPSGLHLCHLLLLLPLLVVNLRYLLLFAENLGQFNPLLILIFTLLDKTLKGYAR